jgi:hypothetical protein
MARRSIDSKEEEEEDGRERNVFQPKNQLEEMNVRDNQEVKQEEIINGQDEDNNDVIDSNETREIFSFRV